MTVILEHEFSVGGLAAGRRALGSIGDSGLSPCTLGVVGKGRFGGGGGHLLGRGTSQNISGATVVTPGHRLSLIS